MPRVGWVVAYFEVLFNDKDLFSVLMDISLYYTINLHVGLIQASSTDTHFFSQNWKWICADTLQGHYLLHAIDVLIKEQINLLLFFFSVILFFM